MRIEVFNMDEAHFVVNMDNNRTLGFRGDKSIQYLDVVSGGEGMTLVIKIRGGASARIEPPMVIFQNKNRSYPIERVPDDVPGVTYRSGPKGWMDHQVFHQWVADNTCNRRHPRCKHQVVYIDNASGHSVEGCKDELSSKNMSIKFLPPNATHLCQPADSFIIKAIKEMWSTEWEKEKFRLEQKKAFSKPKANGKWSGKLSNPGKHFFLELAARCVRAISQKVDKDGVSYPRKAMILCGMSKNVNGVWEESQFSKHLQEIIEKYRDEFEGKKTD